MVAYYSRITAISMIVKWGVVGLVAMYCHRSMACICSTIAIHIGVQMPNLVFTMIDCARHGLYFDYYS
jgi:hypothetical protein